MKRFLRVMKFAGLGLVALVAVALVARAITDARASRRLDERLSQLRADHLPLRIAELERSSVTPEQNAATYLRSAAEATLAIDKELGSAYEAHSENEQAEIDAGCLPESMKDAIRAAFAARPQVIPLLEQASNCPNYDPQWELREPLVESLIEQAVSRRAVIRALNYRAELQVADGQRDDAVQTLLVMFRLSRHFDRAPAIIGYLVALACRGMSADTLNVALRSGPVSDESRDAIDEELARHDLARSFRNSLVTERVLGLQLIDDMFRKGILRANGWVWPALCKNAQSDYLDTIALADSTASRPYADAKETLKLQNSRSWWAGSILPAIEAAHVATNRGQAYLRAVRVLNAIQRYEQLHPNSEPTLSDVRLPAEVTTDPFNGEPLRLKKLPEGWLIYSVDRNLKDDGGDIDQTNDVGLGPIKPASHQPEAQAKESDDQ